MPRNLPAELAPVMARLDRRWPEADEDALRGAAGLWREFGGEADRLGRRGAAAAQRVTGENSGPAVDAFADHWRGFSGGGRGQLDDAHTAAEAIAAAFDEAAAATDSCKADLVAVLTELAEEIKKADAAEAAADAQQKAGAAEGLGGLLDRAAGAVKGTAARAGEAVAVETARVKVGGLLDELGRAMRDALRAALKEPAVTTLERIAQTDGAGRHGELRAVSAARSGGQLTGALAATAVGGAAAVTGVKGLSAEVGPDGRVVTDAQGRPVVLGPDGRPVTGLDGVTVAVDAHGRPVLGEDGQPVVVGADGKPVAGVALGADGKPLTDAHGRPLTVGADGAVGATGLSVAIGEDGQPLLGKDGRPVMLDAEGKPAGGLVVGTDGRLLTDGHGHELVAGVGPDGKPPVDPAAGPGGLRIGPDGVRIGPDGRPVAVVDTGAGGLPGTSGAPGGRVPVDGPGATADPVGPVAAAVVVPTPIPAHAPDGGGHRGYGAAYGGGGAGGYGGGSDTHRYNAPAVSEPDYDLPAPAPSRPSGAPTVHTDSVAVAPPSAPYAGGSSFDDAPPVHAGGRGGDPFPPAAASGGGAPSGFQLGPVGGAPAAGGAPVVGAPVGSPVGAPVGAPVGTPVGAPAAGVPLGGAPGTPGAPGTAGAGAPGGPGGSAAVVGAVPGTSGGAARTPAGTAGPVAPGAAPGATAQAPLPFRLGEQVGEGRRRFDGPGTEAHPDGTVVPVVQPGLVAAGYLAARAGGVADDPTGERSGARSTADGRPYGLPGGLGPVDPAHQAELERLTDRPDAGPEAPLPDPTAGTWVEALNGGGPREAGRANNCVDVVLSAVDTLAGLPVCAAPRLPDGPAGERGGRDRAERELGTRFRDLGDGSGALARLGEVLLRSGPGAQAVLLTLDAFGRSHTWSAVVLDDALVYVDPQTGRVGSEPLHTADHGLWAIAVDDRRRPLDPGELPTAVPAAAVAPEPEPAAVPEPSPEPGPEPAAGPARPAEPAPPRSRLTVHRTTAGSTRR